MKASRKPLGSTRRKAAPQLPQAVEPADAAVATRQRLLETAGEVFAERGFRAATVREICDRAGANVAAVNYHFGGKEKFYAEIFRHWMLERHRMFPPDQGLRAQATPEEKLRAFVRAALLRLFGEKGTPSWLSRLMANEMIEPTPALGSLVDELFRSQIEQLEAILRDLLGTAASPQRVRLCFWSVVGQWVVYHSTRHLMARLEPDRKFDASEIERLADHIVAFSLAALRNLKA
jgi:TetR/AcrR family transcriptional regulator, regulator of cefoperazone and chloramphenicol sensitivity